MLIMRNYLESGFLLEHNFFDNLGSNQNEGEENDKRQLILEN